MRTEDDRMNEHEKFKELGALADTGTLTPSEWAELQGHLQICASCSEIYHQYRILAIEGIPLLADRHSHRPEQGSWNTSVLICDVSGPPYCLGAFQKVAVSIS